MWNLLSTYRFLLEKAYYDSYRSKTIKLMAPMGILLLMDAAKAIVLFLKINNKIYFAVNNL